MDSVIFQLFLEHVESLLCGSIFHDGLFASNVPGLFSCFDSRRPHLMNNQSQYWEYGKKGEVLLINSHDIWTSNSNSGDRLLLSRWNMIVKRQDDPVTWTNLGLLKL